ncbi:MFS transporter [Desertimonas flava]|uniref:MFS transporter n=1 Tax=Desertimonas flava TaxID=2064846 RepID=UPI000E34C0DB|nr:MFS transporter [Desertimonas flava]
MHSSVTAVDYDGIDPHVYDRRWKTLAVLCSSLMIVIVGNTVLNVALPRLQQATERGGIGASNSEIQWIVDAYGLVFAGLLFTAAALGDRFGRKGALQAGLVIFGLGSLLGAIGDSSATLIAARAIMGVGAAFVMPSTLSILTNVFPARERAKAIAIWAGISGGGAAIGPITSGLLLEHFWWGSVFLINLPIIVGALIAGWFLVPRSKDATESPLDPIGALLSILGLGALVYAIIEGPHHGWVSIESLLWFGGAAVLLVAFCWWEVRNPHPMLDLQLFRSSRFSVASGGITLTFFAMFGSFFVVTQYFQGVLGYSPLGAAVRLLPMSFVMMTVAPMTPKLVARLGANVVGAVGMLSVAVGLGGSALFDVDTSYAQVLVTIIFLAAGMALTMTPMTTQLMASVPRDRAGMGSATNDTTRELGGALGVAVLGSLVAGRYSEGIASAVRSIDNADVRGAASAGLGGARSMFDEGLLPREVLDAARRAFVDGFSLAMVVAASVVVIAAVTVFKLLPSDRNASEVTGEGGPGAGQFDEEPVAVAGD